ncbi:hypothetical protein [Moheibacter sediminis]|uniref:Uncharacterized protein n=1 Tax=Moheibacter sediminis TaxID=1434700 RepID=A0A1W2A947_9FLAO|nr:hypothetical protein [Moheibacter sediminis]SMC57170.1 hypothetical protein SAMN06296427_10433 [Moheibacter sediminis]
MKKAALLIALCLAGINSFGQIDKLENFRKELMLYMDYDQRATDAKNESEAKELKENVEKVFRKFVLDKESKNTDRLKTEAESSNYSYSFSNVKREKMVQSTENNEDFKISFYGMYDYKLSNFVSIYIQPFLLSKNELCVYYYKLNGKGKYFVKEIDSNKIIFTSEGLTSNAAVIKIHQIDKNHVLIIEDMGDDGQRALVVKTEKKEWAAVEGFKGNLIEHNNEKKFAESRKYLRLVSNKTIQNHQSFGFLKQNGIRYNEELKTIVYSISEDNLTFKEAKWEGKLFVIDDYYLGDHLPDEPMPFPG